MRKIDDLEGFPLDDGQSFRFQSDPDLAAAGGDAPHHFSRKERVSVFIGAGPVDVERLVGGTVDAHASQGAGHDLAVRRQAQSRDFVIRDGPGVCVGMAKTGGTSGGDVHPEQTLQRADPHHVSCAKIGRGPVVFPDMDVRQHPGHAKALVFDIPDLEQASFLGDPRRTVSVHIADFGHEVDVGDLALQGIDKDGAPVVGEGDPVQLIV